MERAKLKVCIETAECVVCVVCVAPEQQKRADSETMGGDEGGRGV